MRYLLRVAALAGCVFAVSVCGEQGKFPTTPTGGGTSGGTSGSDVVPPNVYIVLPTPPHDTIQDISDSLKFTMADTDNVRLKSVQVNVTGLAGYSFSFTDSATVGVAGFVKSYAVPLKRGGAGKHVKVEAIATDASNNLNSKIDTILLVDQTPPIVTMVAPAGATTIGAGSTFKVVTSASDISGVLLQGARLYTLNNLNQRVVLLADTNFYPTAPGNKTDSIAVHIPATVAPGAYQVQTFARDSSPTPNDTVSSSQGVQVITVLAPFGNWVFPPQDTAIVAGSSFLASFDAKDSAGVTNIVFSAYSDSGNVSLGTFGTRPRYTAPGATMVSPYPKDTTIQRVFTANIDSSVDSAFIAATVTNVGGVTSTIARRVQIVRGPSVLVSAPATLSRVPTGPVNDPITIVAYSPNGVSKLGFIASGVAAAGDSFTFTAPYANAQTNIRFLNTPATTPLGVDTIVPFAVNGLGARFTGKPILVAFADTVKPAVAVQAPSKTSILTIAVTDSILVQAHVMDNRGVVRIAMRGIAKRGSAQLGTDTVVTRDSLLRVITLPQTTDTVLTRYLHPPQPIDSTSEYAYIVVTAYDSSGNFQTDTAQYRIVNGPKVTILSPTNNSVTAPGKIITVSVQAKGTLSVRTLGWRATVNGTIIKSDSTMPALGSLTNSLAFTSNDTVPAGTPSGSQLLITGFALDTLGNPSPTLAPDTVLVQATVATAPPTVTFSVPARVEVGDSITVSATGAAGVGRIGFAVHHLGANDTLQLARFADTLNGTNTNVIARFRLNLDTLTIGTAVQQVTVGAFAWDSSGAAYAVAPTLDTLTVVAGTTVGLPQGGKFGDAIVDPNNQTMYLSNTLLDQLEVFNLNTRTFGAPIRVGSQPVGLALWPRDTMGDNADTVIVANSGGTNFSIVDVAAGRELNRHVLPDYIVQTVKTAPTAAGGIEILTTDYDLSDRPQYVGAVCRHLTGATCDSVVAVYSTTPTPAEPGPFTNRGYLAWENLSNPAGRSGHFLWELANAGTDTIQIISVRDTLPGQQLRDTILGAGVGTLVTLSTIAFQESTFVRNSGDFNHTVIGEGGLNQGFARALTFDGRQSVVTSVNPPCPLKSPTGTILGYLNCDITYDQGMSPGVYVSDFLINRASSVLSVGTNFNGRTNVVRADSIYVFNYALKQVGLLQTFGSSPGMDVDPANKFDPMQPVPASPPAGYNNDRLVLAARSDAAIDVFDTYWYQRVATVPIRDTIVGPVRVAKSGGALVLAGVTSRGVVVVRLPNFSNPLPSSPARPPLAVTSGRPVIVRATGRKVPAQR